MEYYDIFDLNNLIFRILKDSGIESQISGGLYSRTRPDDSVLEDIVVNTLSLTTEYTPQQGTVNINIHVPDIKVNINGKTNSKLNAVRLEQLGKAVCDIIENVNMQGFNISVSAVSLLEESERQEHFANIRVQIYIFIKH